MEVIKPIGCTWYFARYNMCGRRCGGFGATYAAAIAACLKDMQVVASL